jgi:GT2 family glycosyltransferase
LAQLRYPRHRLEIVIVDDGGGDVSASLMDLPQDLRVRLVTQKNRGPASARNRGAIEAAGDVLAFTDDDCRPRPAWLLDLTAGLAAEPRALMGGAVVNALSSNLFAQASQDLVSFLYEYFPDGRSLLPFFTSNNIACYRGAFLKVGGFDETFRFSAAEDRDLSERWAAEVGPLRHVPGAVVDHQHALAFGRFLRQHHYYGRGAVHLARRRQKRGQGRPRPEPPVFYAKMLVYPIRHHGWLRGGGIAALVSLAQLSGLSGMLVEAINPSYRDEGRSR